MNFLFGPGLLDCNENESTSVELYCIIILLCPNMSTILHSLSGNRSNIKFKLNIIQQQLISKF